MIEKILIMEAVDPCAYEFLQSRGYEVIMASDPLCPGVLNELPGISGILVRNTPVTAEMMDAAGCLRVIGRHGVGVNRIDLHAAKERGIRVTNAPLSNSNAVAEHTMMLILCCAKHFRIADLAFRAGDYAVRDRIRSTELRSSVLGVLGLGRIGKSVASSAFYGFGMKVLGYDPYVSEVPDWIERCSSVDDVLRESDFVTLHMPLTSETANLMDMKRLMLMKRNSCLINTARGGLVDENALTAALSSGAIAGAALDLLADEPPDPANILFSMPNVILTPHCAAHTKDAFIKMAMHAAQGIDDVLSGREPEWPVV